VTVDALDEMCIMMAQRRHHRALDADILEGDGG
jgi:hypothetical protein